MSRGLLIAAFVFFTLETTMVCFFLARPKYSRLTLLALMLGGIGLLCWVAAAIVGES
jgi:hypothetical protein